MKIEIITKPNKELKERDFGSLKPYNSLFLSFLNHTSSYQNRDTSLVRI